MTLPRLTILSSDSKVKSMKEKKEKITNFSCCTVSDLKNYFLKEDIRKNLMKEGKNTLDTKIWA